MLLLAAVTLPLLQLIPLPPSWWQSLPGREILLIPNQTPPWRPLTMTPSATWNALSSLVVPAAMLLLILQSNERARARLLPVLLAMVSAAVLLGLLQFSGARVDHPLLNDTPGEVSSIFANRNHLGLLIAIGCLIVPVWAFTEDANLRWRGPVAAGLLPLFLLTILATGSRSGMLLGALSIPLSLAVVTPRLRQRLSGAPIWILPALIIACAILIVGLTYLSFSADRAEAINRLISLDSDQDMRKRALPTVLAMISHYMPWGSGFGGFDPVFRVHEPFDLLKLTFFNQAHNDYLGIALDGGIAAIVVAASGLLWWGVATMRVWRAEANESTLRGRLGSAIILLVLLASITDYPARTPTIMAVLIAAAAWLSDASSRKSSTRFTGIGV